ncbi:hypothetical protein MPSI1_000796 [Malassezia psittaci]|uniref:Ribosomal RNA-processing protein 42 n=1 Tax=Malassezia psittaci TaxID=1821823 RepID=A0AAF0FCC1_9BASI|nr:hypothetical protein MPSI1_000796 [Malassezia psittaci]
MSLATLSRAERSYILDGLLDAQSHRLDGRGLKDFRSFEVKATSTPQADGIAHLMLGSTEVMCGVKAEVEAYQAPRVQCHSKSGTESFSPWIPPTPRVRTNVEFSPALLHEHSAVELSMITSTVQEMLSACFREQVDRFGPLMARQFILVPYAKYWTLYLDIYVFSWSGGNVLDALFAAVFLALSNTRLPGTKMLSTDVAKERNGSAEAANGTADDPMGMKFITRGKKSASAQSTSHALDFALEDEWGKGYALDGRDEMPVCISVYPIGETFLLDPTLEEESSLSVSISVLASASGRLYGVRQRGDGEITLHTLHKATEVGIQYAQQLAKTLSQ